MYEMWAVREDRVPSCHLAPTPVNVTGVYSDHNYGRKQVTHAQRLHLAQQEAVGDYGTAAHFRCKCLLQSGNEDDSVHVGNEDWDWLVVQQEVVVTETENRPTEYHQMEMTESENRPTEYHQMVMTENRPTEYHQEVVVTDTENRPTEYHQMVLTESENRPTEYHQEVVVTDTENRPTEYHQMGMTESENRPTEYHQMVMTESENRPTEYHQEVGMTENRPTEYHQEVGLMETTVVGHCDDAPQATDGSAVQFTHQGRGCSPMGSIHTQTDSANAVTCVDIDGMRAEINRLLEENRTLKKKLSDKEMEPMMFEGDNEKLKYYTGLPAYATLKALLKHVTPFLPQGSRRRLSPFQMLLVVFMRLRLNLPVQLLGYMFQVHRTTIANSFVPTVSVMYTRLAPFVFWPKRGSLKASVPCQFVQAFGDRVAMIVHCFEVSIGRRSKVKARLQTAAQNRLKYLIGITPQGVITFISNGYGECSSDKYVIEQSGFLDKLLPGDIVLSVQSSDMQDSVEFMCAEVKSPAHSRGKLHVVVKNKAETRALIHLQSHVDKVTELVGNVVEKYSFLSNGVPAKLTQLCDGENLTFLDKMVTVCCALTNMCPGVVFSDAHSSFETVQDERNDT